MADQLSRWQVFLPGSLSEQRILLSAPKNKFQDGLYYESTRDAASFAVGTPVTRRPPAKIPASGTTALGRPVKMLRRHVRTVRRVACERTQMQFSAATCIDEWQIKAHGGAFRPIIRTIMAFILQPWQLFLVILAGWMNRQHQEAISTIRSRSAISRRFNMQNSQYFGVVRVF